MADLIDSRRLNEFYKGIKQRFLMYSSPESERFVNSAVADFLSENNFSTTDGKPTNLDGYIRSLVMSIISSSIVGELLDEKYDDVRVFDFAYLYDICVFMISKLDSLQGSISDSSIQSGKSTFESLLPLVEQDKITSQEYYDEKYELICKLAKQYIPEYSSIIGNPFNAFPYVGHNDALYLDNSTNIQYTWDNNTKSYKPIAKPISESSLDDMFN